MTSQCSSTRSGPAHGRQSGFSLIELTIVIAIIMVLAAVSAPAINNFVRVQRVKGAVSDVANEINAARMRAIATNTRQGVSFMITDANSYRFVMEDAVEVPFPGNLGPLKTLPVGMVFVPDGANATGFRFKRMGQWCAPGNSGCTPIAPAVVCNGELECTDLPTGNFVTSVAAGAGAGAVVAIMEQRSGLTRFVRVAPGGRVRDTNQ